MNCSTRCRPSRRNQSASATSSDEENHRLRPRQGLRQLSSPKRNPKQGNAMTIKEKFTAEVTLPSDTEVRVTRSFHAPRTLVWQAHTVPELARRWLGYPGWSM